MKRWLRLLACIPLVFLIAAIVNLYDRLRAIADGFFVRLAMKGAALSDYIEPDLKAVGLLPNGYQAPEQYQRVHRKTDD